MGSKPVVIHRTKELQLKSHSPKEPRLRGARLPIWPKEAQIEFHAPEQVLSVFHGPYWGAFPRLAQAPAVPAPASTSAEEPVETGDVEATAAEFLVGVFR